MQHSLPDFQRQKGQGLVEALIAFAVLIILFHALSSLIITAYDLLGNSRTRTTARFLANARMEEIRNMPYDDIGLVGGIPHGTLLQEEIKNANGLDFTLRTSVVFIDDPFDQTAPNDSDPSDYKRARVDVSWKGRFNIGESVILVSDFSGEEPQTGGTLRILVFDANVNPVPQADVHIVNNLVSPPIDVTFQTDDQGMLSLPGYPACDNCYQISVTKDNYSTDRTYSTTEVANPYKPHASLIESQITSVAFSIDRNAVLHLTSTRDRNNNFALLGNKTFRLKGNKMIGTDNTGLPVYKYNQSLQTDASGHLSLNNLEWDSYTLSLDPNSWDLAGSNPLNPLLVMPAADLNQLFASSSHQTNSLLLAITDASGLAIATASSILTGPGGYNQTAYSGESPDPDFGQAFFSPLVSGTYMAQVSKTGYEPVTETIDVSGQTQRTISLNQL